MTGGRDDAHERSRFVEDLLSYMTLAEKLGQLDLTHDANDPGLEDMVASGQVGGIAGAADPSRLQVLAVEHSRLGIPLLLFAPPIEPELSPWALAASWDEGLAYALGASTARAAIRNGYNSVLAPRVADTPGQAQQTCEIAASETHLAAQLTAAFVAGACDGEASDQRAGILATPVWRPIAKGKSLNWGLGVVRDERVMAIDCPALNRPLAQRVGFGGLLPSECRRITACVQHQFTTTSASTPVEAAERAIAAGLLSELEIEVAVRGVLAAKHARGLFRDPKRVVSPANSADAPGGDALATRATFVLLRNEAGILPLSPVSDRVLVVGPSEGVAAACAGALGRAGIGYSVAPGLALRRPDETWGQPASGDSIALSLTGDAARRADFALVVLEDRHFAAAVDDGWRRPHGVTLMMLRGLAMAGARLVAIIAVDEPVDLADADQHFAAVLHCWRPGPGFEEALSDVLSGRFGPQGRMPAGAGRYQSGHGLGYGESVLSNFSLALDQNGIVAAVDVRNGGAFAMRETIQVYLRKDDEGLRLVAFEHVQLEPGEQQHCAITLGPDALCLSYDENRLNVVPGRYEIAVGKSSGRLTTAHIDLTPSQARSLSLREASVLRLATG